MLHQSHQEYSTILNNHYKEQLKQFKLDFSYAERALLIQLIILINSCQNDDEMFEKVSLFLQSYPVSDKYFDLISQVYTLDQRQIDNEQREAFSSSRSRYIRDLFKNFQYLYKKHNDKQTAKNDDQWKYTYPLGDLDEIWTDGLGEWQRLMSQTTGENPTKAFVDYQRDYLLGGNYYFKIKDNIPIKMVRRKHLNDIDQQDDISIIFEDEALTAYWFDENKTIKKVSCLKKEALALVEQLPDAGNYFKLSQINQMGEHPLFTNIINHKKCHHYVDQFVDQLQDTTENKLLIAEFLKRCGGQEMIRFVELAFIEQHFGQEFRIGVSNPLVLNWKIKNNRITFLYQVDILALNLYLTPYCINLKHPFFLKASDPEIQKNKKQLKPIMRMDAEIILVVEKDLTYSSIVKPKIVHWNVCCYASRAFDENLLPSPNEDLRSPAENLKITAQLKKGAPLQLISSQGVHTEYAIALHKFAEFELKEKAKIKITADADKTGRVLSPIEMEEEIRRHMSPNHFDDFLSPLCLAILLKQQITPAEKEKFYGIVEAWKTSVDLPANLQYRCANIQQILLNILYEYKDLHSKKNKLPPEQSQSRSYHSEVFYEQWLESETYKQLLHFIVSHTAAEIKAVNYLKDWLQQISYQLRFDRRSDIPEWINQLNFSMRVLTCDSLTFRELILLIHMDPDNYVGRFILDGCMREDKEQLNLMGNFHSQLKEYASSGRLIETNLLVAFLRELDSNTWNKLNALKEINLVGRALANNIKEIHQQFKNTKQDRVTEVNRILDSATPLTIITYLLSSLFFYRDYIETQSLKSISAVTYHRLCNTGLFGNLLQSAMQHEDKLIFDLLKGQYEHFYSYFKHNESIRNTLTQMGFSMSLMPMTYYELICHQAEKSEALLSTSANAITTLSTTPKTTVTAISLFNQNEANSPVPQLRAQNSTEQQGPFMKNGM